jgi:hypothetical protein
MENQKTEGDKPVKSIPVMTKGAKMTLGACPAHRNATLTIADPNTGEALLMIDMSAKHCLALAADFARVAAQLVTLAPDLDACAQMAN